jgi:hypothetical protein
MARAWKKRHNKPTMTLKAPEPVQAPEPPRTGPYAHTRILRGLEIPPVCGRCYVGGCHGR